jgi:hypothetical protein
MIWSYPKMIVSFIAFSLGLATAQPAWSDQWTTLITPTAVHAEDFSGVLGIYINTAQAVINPANCPSSDGYSVTDPVITNQALAIVLTAITSAQQIMLYVSSSTCAGNGRPLVLTVQLQ